MAERWIVVPNWERFQHYGTARRPIWIKNYTALIRKSEYRDLTLSDRGLLHGIWLAYAEYEGRLRPKEVAEVIHRPDGTRTPRAHKLHTFRTIERLNHAGFLDFVASRPLLLDLKEPKGTVTPPAGARLVNGSRTDRDAANVARLIANGVIHDDIDLTAELRDYGIDGELAATLRQQLSSRLRSELEL
jgi:hypothetical protein